MFGISKCDIAQCVVWVCKCGMAVAWSLGVAQTGLVWLGVSGCGIYSVGVA